MLKLIICGINGAMGTNIYNSAIKAGHHVTCGIDNILVTEKDCPVFSDFEQIRHLADVIVDFSSPTITEKLLEFATENCLPIVIGTTGHSTKQEELISKTSNIIPIFKSANMSLGINLLIKLCQQAMHNLKNFDIEIIEKHHKNKIDSPSGTTNLILNGINNNLENKKSPSYGRKGNLKRNDTEIGIHSLRGGSIIGEHTVCFLGENENITITHSANSKQLFAQGAIKACEFIASKKSGLYDVNHLIID